MQICHRYLTTIEASTLVGLVCFLVGITLSYALSIPTGPCIVLINLIALFAAIGLRKWRESGRMA